MRQALHVATVPLLRHPQDHGGALATFSRQGLGVEPGQVPGEELAQVGTVVHCRQDSPLRRPALALHEARPGGLWRGGLVDRTGQPGRVAECKPASGCPATAPPPPHH